MKKPLLMSAVALAAFCCAAPLSAQTQTQTPTQPQTQTPSTSTSSPTATPTTMTPQTQPVGTTGTMTIGTTGTTTAGGATPIADSDFSTSIALLERALSVLDTTVNGKDGNGGKETKGGNVSIDRGLLDEVRAELTQVRLTLKGEKK